jgi:hypothetical protein
MAGLLLRKRRGINVERAEFELPALAESGQSHFIFAERDIARNAPVRTRLLFASSRFELVKEQERLGGTHC